MENSKLMPEEDLVRLFLDDENFCICLGLWKSMHLREKNALACTDDPCQLADRIDTSIAYISVCAVRLRINSLMYEMGRMSGQELREQTQEILGKIIDEIVDIRDIISTEAFKNKFKNDRFISERILMQRSKRWIN